MTPDIETSTAKLADHRSATLGNLRKLIDFANQCFPGYRLSGLKLKARMLWNGIRNGGSVRPFLESGISEALDEIVRERPQILGALVWPYQNANWPVSERLRRIASHYEVVNKSCWSYDFGVNEKLILLDMSERMENLRIIMDQPKWFMREGGLVINLFVGDFRAYSLAFSLYSEADGGLELVIGGLQGRKTDGAIDMYREMTKAFDAIRPRDLLIEIVRMLSRKAGVDRILAVSQSARHHQHPFFGKRELTPDYDLIWTERDGTRVDEAFFELAVDPGYRDLNTVKPKKRSLYRRRRAFLETLENSLQDTKPKITTFSAT